MFIRTFQLLICASLVLSGLACGSKSGDRGSRANSNGDDSSKASVVTITVAKSESRDIAASIQATGSTVADESSDVAPKVAGKIADLSVNVGQFVTVGSVVARIDDRDAKLQLSSALAGVKKAQSAVLQAQARLGLGPGNKFNSSTIPEVRAAAAAYEQSLAELKQAEANEKRYRELTETGDVSMITYEQYRTARDTARTRSNSAKQLMEAAVNTARQNNQAIASAQADVESAQTQVATAKQALADTVIRAPFSGFVSNRPVAVGEFVSSASVVATVLKTNPMKVQIRVAEADVPFISLGRGVSVEVDAYKERKFAGIVTSVNPAIDPVSRAAIVETSIENADNALRSGMFATVKINREGGGKAVFVPRSAVFEDQATNSSRVFVVQEGVVRLKVVQKGVEEADWIQIVTGVEPDQTVATSNLAQLYEGAAVAF